MGRNIVTSSVCQQRIAKNGFDCISLDVACSGGGCEIQKGYFTIGYDILIQVDELLLFEHFWKLFCYLSIDAQVSHLMHIHKLAGYRYVLFIFHEPLVAVPFHP